MQGAGRFVSCLLFIHVGLTWFELMCFVTWQYRRCSIGRVCSFTIIYMLHIKRKRSNIWPAKRGQLDVNACCQYMCDLILFCTWNPLHFHSRCDRFSCFLFLERKFVILGLELDHFVKAHYEHDLSLINC